MTTTDNNHNNHQHVTDDVLMMEGAVAVALAGQHVHDDDTTTTTTNNNPIIKNTITTNTRFCPSNIIDHDEILLLRKETDRKNSFYLMILNTYAAFFVFIRHLITIESMFSILLSVGLTIYIYIITKDEASFDGNTMSWILLTFAVITPIGSTISMTFTRREQALQSISTLRSTFIELYTSYTIWGWDYIPGNIVINGRTKSTLNWLHETDIALSEILLICNDVIRILTLPCHTRARHKVTSSGMMEANKIHDIHTRFMESIVVRFGHLAEFCELLKREGLPPNESNRIRQWERICLDAIERLRVIKMYRTPQGLRSFGRLFSMFLPPFYSPYYAQLAHDINSLGTGIMFSIFTALALTALFETITQMEDPFVATSYLDGVDVQSDLMDGFKPQLLALRKRYYPESIPFKDRLEKGEC